MAYITGVHAGSSSQLFKHWWQWLLIGFWAFAVLLGSGYIAFSLVTKLWRYAKRETQTPESLRKKVATHLKTYVNLGSELSLEKCAKEKPQSLGIYLGAFAEENYVPQTKRLSSQDLIILDPRQPKVVSFLGHLLQFPRRPRHIIGRLDINILMETSLRSSQSEKGYMLWLDQIMTAILTHLRDYEGSYNGFTGALLVNWDLLPTTLLHELSHVIAQLDLEVYLEVSAPDFMKDPQVLQSESIVGLVICNGIIQADGERQDCFGIEDLHTTVKAFVTEACVRDFVVLAWETVDDDTVISDAVLRRTFNWCKFYNVLPWIGPRAALLDPTVDVIALEPLSAFAWLKEPRVMEIHSIWKDRRASQTTSGHAPPDDSIYGLVPSLKALQQYELCPHNSLETKSLPSHGASDVESLGMRDAVLCDPICMSASGKSYNELGCFPLGLDVSPEDYEEIIFSQRNLRKLELLDAVSPTTLREFGLLFAAFAAGDYLSSSPQNTNVPLVQEMIMGLAKILKVSPEDGSEGLRVFLGLHSGFQRSLERQFWGVVHIHPANTIDIYISKTSKDVVGTLLHTYLSCRGATRRQCLAAEQTFAYWNQKINSNRDIPPRIQQDIDILSPEESILLLQRFSLYSGTENDTFIKGIASALTKKLIDVPLWQKLKAENTVEYLRGEITLQEMLENRLEWHCQCKRQHPSHGKSVSLFQEVERIINHALRSRCHNDLHTIVDSLDDYLRRPTISAATDIFALSVFVTMRKLAFEEVYIEVTDRNPLFNDQPDQSAAFAELFALGSRCEAYFDVTSSQFGELLSKRFTDYYSVPQHQPPIFKEKNTGLNSAYAEAQIDVDPTYKSTPLPALLRFTFLSVFAIPALIDILLLTTTGHGLYLSGLTETMTFMTYEEQHSATTALMISLLLSGGIGTWISCGGTYYLSSMAFSAMNYFVVTRLLGGFAFTIIVAILGFVVFISVSSFHAAIVFFLYLIVLTTYLSLLAALANYQFIGSAFQSGRKAIICCIPILFISPITTIFVPNHDIYIYLSVLYVFVFCLLLGVRYTGSRWTTWYQEINLIDDGQLRNWYLESMTAIRPDVFEKMSDPAVLRLARRSLSHEIELECRKGFFAPKTRDPLVAKLAKSFEATDFLMDWYCKFSGVARPILFSSAWNVQTKVALFSLQKSQLGIRFHNGFLHWRQAGDEIGCTVLYFILALLDKWIALIDGGLATGLINAKNTTLTMPIGFSLAYYLVGAVLLDFNGHKLHQLASRKTEENITTNGDISQVAWTKCMNRRKLYWGTLGRFLCWHAWGLAATTTLIWLFSSTRDNGTGATIFFSYALAYTGLLWYQYTKIFSGPHALKPLITGVAIGLILGFVLDHKLRKFTYSDIIALGVATWTTAILSLWGARIVGRPEDLPLPVNNSTGAYHTYSYPDIDHHWSQAELQSLHEKLCDIPKKERLHIDPESEFGNQVKVILNQVALTNISTLAQRAFPDAEALFTLTKRMFSERFVQVELLSVAHFPQSDQSMRALTVTEGANIQLLVSCETKYIPKSEDPLKGFYWDVAELLIQVVAERYLGYSKHDGVLAQSLLFNTSVWNKGLGGLDSIERQMKSCTRKGDLDEQLKQLRHDVLRNICLGFDFDAEWEPLPIDLRQFLLERCLGKSSPLNDKQCQQLNSKVNKTAGLNFETYVARCEYSASLGAKLLSIVTSREILNTHQSHSRSTSGDISSASSQRSTPIPWTVASALLEPAGPPKYTSYDKFLKYCGSIYHYIGTICKFMFIAFVADPEYQRELQFMFSRTNRPWHKFTRFILLTIWHLSKSVQSLLLPYFLFYRRPGVVTTWKNIQGMEVTIKRRRVVIRNIDGILTGFFHEIDDGAFRLLQYRGDHKIEPSTKANLVAINMYATNMTLLRRVELENESTVNDYVYDYRRQDPSALRRLSRGDALTSPITRKGIAGRDELQNISYNSKGQIDSGSYVKDGNIIRFQYHYQKSSRFSSALLRAEFVLPHLSCTVSWCAAPRRRPERLESWIPHSQVTETTFVVGADVWESKYFYDHKFHPTIVTTLNGQKVETPALILYDHLDVLKRPTKVSFLNDNPLYGFKSKRTFAVTRWLGLHTHRYLCSTPEARSLLWKAWKDNSAFDGVIVRWLDERLLRREPILRPYWRKRDLGHLEAAEAYLDQNRDAVMACVDLDPTVSSWTPLAIKVNDLYTFGQGGDACSMTRSNLIAQEDDETALHVIAVDTGTWPNESGGVTACRSDVINNLKSIKWHMVAESANDFGIPKRQIERNVHSLKIIPLWGLDLMTPTHGLFTNRLDSEVDYLSTHIARLDIERSFVPILRALVHGARALDFSMADVKQVTRALVALNAYFEENRNWSTVWRSEIVKAAWRQAWLDQHIKNTRPLYEWLNTELPTLGQLDQALELWSRYLFIYSIPIPEKMPAIFQASHHSASASYGIVCKIKRGCTLQIWDHAISWRETNLYLSSALCPLSPFVRNSLLGMMRMTSVVILHHADTILPCADFFNPGWEIEIGTCQGRIENRSIFKRKIDPVVNGITHIERFTPVKEIKTTVPTVTMLSHIWFAKDIKTAILAADIIVNEWGFKDYKLEIYGAIDKTPSYTTSCQEILATKSLRYNVTLMGEADPIYVLERTWAFLNSSVSEGLPLALGEAALTGAPVVCTDVGASLRVLTNPEDGACYSAVVAPNDAFAMARAQIKLLALLEEWNQYSDPSVSSPDALDSTFPEIPSAEDVARITKRMYEQSDSRRKLGMRSREIVQKSFSGDRYLREHEQMLWIGKARKDMRQPHSLRPSARHTTPAPVRILDLAGSNVQRDGRVPSHLTNRTTLPRDSLQVPTSLPSLSMALGSKTTSLMTDNGPSTTGGVMVGEQEWIRKPVGKVNVVEVNVNANVHIRTSGEVWSLKRGGKGGVGSPLTEEVV